MKSIDMRQELVNLGGGAHALAIQILGNSQDAADAVHDAFATVLARPGAYDRKKGRSSPGSFASSGIARLTSCAAAVRLSRWMRWSTPERFRNRPWRIRQRDEGLQRALAELPSGQREIILLRDYLDLSYAEIADVLDVAAGTVMSRLHRARMALKEVLESNHE